MSDGEQRIARRVHPGRPPRDYPVRRLTIELPADLLAALDAATRNRTAILPLDNTLRTYYTMASGCD